MDIPPLIFIYIIYSQLKLIELQYTPEIAMRCVLAHLADGIIAYALSRGWVGFVTGIKCGSMQ